ncbi:tetratricopeptide repeat protein [Vibrio salinus]|uniref:tetratricopeptide repeat protein n=1 Tax=Vibrio salinus TaxID=2899784 RepID=UPI001E35B4D3|nr:hypothetical protein [Vibrio salinus]MCE0492514.1 hypothetical protein [Vibrio salinus]
MKMSISKTLLILCTLLSANLCASELSRYTTQKIVSAQAMAENGKFHKAIAILKSISTNRPYDQAYINRILGVYFWQADNSDKAIQYLSLAVNSGQLKDRNAWDTEKMLAELLLNEQRFKKALVHYHHLLQSKEAKDKPVLTLRIAQINYQLEKWKSVISSMNSYESYGLPDALTPLSIKLGAELQLHQLKTAIKTVKRIIPLESHSRNWWMQLVSLYLQTNQQKLALSSLELAHLNHVALTDKDLRLLSQLYAQNGIPEKAARILSTVRDVTTNHKLTIQLASYWQNAKEWQKARRIWLIAAGKEKKYLWNVAQIDIQQNHYKKAYTTLQKLEGHYPEIKLALAKARVLYRLNRLNSALKLAEKAHKLHPSTETRSWIKYLTRLKHYQTQNNSNNKEKVTDSQNS